MEAKIKEYITKKEKWSKELTQLHAILSELPLDAAIKWGSPTYSHKKKNVIGIAGFKNYFGLWFFQGGLLKDDAKVLQNAQEGKTQAMRQWRFNSVDEIDRDLIKAYVLESIKNFEEGKEIKPNRNKELVIPEELEALLKDNSELNSAFGNLTKGKQREYADHISEAKREATKQKRLEKITPMILSGVGLHDKYKNC